MSRVVARLLAAVSLAFALSLSGCFDVQDYLDFQLNVSPFENDYLDRGEATSEVWLMPGYYCPDDELARIYLIYSNVIETPAPTAVVLHPNAFDYMQSDGTTYSSLDGQNRLTATWAAEDAEKMMGVRSEGPQAYQSGALIAELIREGFYVVVPTNCWGDLWHNAGDNDYAEGFLRNGLFMADDSIKWAVNRLEVDEDRLLLAGLGDGGRGIVDLVKFGWTEPAILIDSSPDLLSGVIGDANYTEFQVGLEKIYGVEDLDEAGFALKLQEYSLMDLVANQGYVAPTVYIYSANDTLVDVDLSRPAANAIESNYPAGLYYPTMESADNRHIITNTTRSEAEAVVDWLIDGWNNDWPAPTD